MGFFSFFSGKKPEDHEQRGDQCLRSGAFGDARIEFEKALHKIETRYQEKKHLAGRIGEKLDSAKESLALQHMENAGAMAGAGDMDEAAELYELALGLASRQETREKIRQAVLALQDGSSKSGASEGKEPAEETGSAPAGERPAELTDSDPEDRDDQELFTVLLNALPAGLAEAYQDYGNSFARGYTALNRGDFALAVRELSAAMEENADRDTLIPLELATAYLHSEQHEEAQNLLESFLRQHPGQIRGYQLLCELYWETGKFEKASGLIDSAPPDIRYSSSMRLLEGETRFQQGDTKGAKEVFLACIDQDGENEIVLRALAKTCESRGETEDARQYYARIMNHCTSCRQVIDPFVKRRFALLSLETGDTSSKLLDLLFSLVSEDPDNRGDYYLGIGRIYEKKGEKKEAARYLELAGRFGH